MGLVIRQRRIKEMAGELSVYLNGKVIEESQARVSPFDRGFLWGDGVYEVTPCFNRRLYRLEDHLDRLYRSLQYVRINPGLSQEEMKAEPVVPCTMSLDSTAVESDIQCV